MRYEVRILRSAEREILRLPIAVRDRVIVALDSLEEVPRPPGCKKLKNSKDLWRIRIGAYRVIYSIHDTIQLVRVERAAHRSEVYR